MGSFQDDLSLTHRMISASAGAVLTSLFVTPLDVVKTRLQAQSRPLVPGTCFVFNNGLMEHLCTYCADPSTSAARECEWYARPPRPSPFTGTLDGLVKIARSEGLTSLWSGLSPTLVIAMPATVGYFTLNDYLCNEGKRRWGERLWVPMLAGSTARSAIVVLINPVEMVRTKLQSERLSYREIGRAIRESKAVEGWRVFWKGLLPTWSRDVVFTAIYWGLLDYLRGWQMRREGRAETNFRISFTSGAFSGVVAAVATHPLDLIKTRRQITLGTGQAESNVRLSEMVRTSGFRSLYAGLTPRLIKVAPACAIMLGTYDFGKNFFTKRRENS